MRAAIAALFVGALFVLSGCQYLFGAAGFGPGSFPGPGGSFDPGDFGSFDPNEPAFSLPPPLATYTTGSATVTIDGTATTLGKLTGTAATYADFGTEVTWTDGAGLYLRFAGAPAFAGLPDSAYVVIDRIADGKHWTSSNPTACPVTVSKSNASGLSGSATCKGLRWMDALSAMSLDPTPIAGEPAFDVAVTFEAAP